MIRLPLNVIRTISNTLKVFLHHQGYWTEMRFYFLHFIKTGYYGDLNQYHTNTISLIDIAIPNQFVFYLRNHYWLLSVKTSLEAKDLTKINHKTTEETKDGPIYNNYWKIELGNTISKQSQNIGVTLFIQIWSHECYIKRFKIFSCSITLWCRENNWPGKHMVNILM